MHYFRISLLFVVLLAMSRVCMAVEVTPGFSGSWYDPSHDGEGFILQVISNESAAVYWFTYDSEGHQQWMSGVGEVSGSTITFSNLIAPVGGKFGANFDPIDVEYPSWGTLVINFTDCSNGSATYAGPPGFGSGTLDISRVSSLWGVDCTGQVNAEPVIAGRFLNPGFSGSWYDEKHNGEGFIVEVISATSAVVFWFTYDTLGNQAWMFGIGEISGATIVIPDMSRPTGGRFGTGFNPADVVFNSWGPSVFTFGSCARAAMRYAPPENFGVEGTQTLQRLIAIGGVDCGFLTDTHAITGTISVAENTFIDADLNDPNWPESSNDLEGGVPQDLVAPARVVGYVTEMATGIVGDRFEKVADQWDSYLVPLKGGEAVELVISDWLTNAPQDIDLDLYLVDAQDINAENIDLTDLADSSLSISATERVVAPRDSLYFIAVEALSGASNYLLTTGLPASAQEAKITVAAPMVEGEIIASIRNNNSLLSATAQQEAVKRISSLEKKFGLQRLSSAKDGSVRYRVKNLRIDTLTPHPLTRNGLASISPVDWLVARQVKALQHHPDFAWAGPNYLVQNQKVPNDPFYSRQWHYPAIKLPQAWDITTGSSEVIVAVLDSGVFEHTDLLANVNYDLGFDFVTDAFSAADGDGIDPDASDPGEVFPVFEPYTSHGTHVAGTIGANSNNGDGVAGVAWDVTLMPVRVIGIDEGDCHDINNGLKWAGQLPNDANTFPERRADIINMSFRSMAPCAGSQAIIDQLNAKGTIVIAAAGNDAISAPVYPAALNGVFSVSATGFSDTLAPYSNFGSSIDLAAPGGDTTTDRNRDGFPDGVWSTGMQVDENLWTPYETFHNFQGTSMAAPHVSGVAALMKSVQPELGPGEFDTALASGEITVDLGQPGRDQQYGYGRIDALRAVRWAQTHAGGSNETTTVTSNLSVLDFGAATQALDLEISKVGDGQLSIVKLHASEPWIHLTSVSLDTSSFGTYRVMVDRAGLQAGSYAGQVGFEGSDGTTLWIPVAMRIGNAVAGNAGYLYALLLDEWSLQNINQWEGLPSDGHYALSLSGVTPGKWFLVVGTDIDNDGSICDPGEFCQFYPSDGDTSPIEIRDDDIDIPSFILTPPEPDKSASGMQTTSFNQSAVAAKKVEKYRLRRR